jgi:hypothetical protein
MENITQKMENLTPKNYRTFSLKMKFPPNFSLGFDFVKACQFNITNSQSILYESWNESLEWVSMSMLLKPPKTIVGHEGSSAMMINLCNNITQTLLQGRLKRIHISK